ncbi:MAG: hypothetical protein AB8G99_25390, partial [Planctomycetaceae bacterium]
ASSRSPEPKLPVYRLVGEQLGEKVARTDQPRVLTLSESRTQIQRLDYERPVPNTQSLAHGGTTMVLNRHSLSSASMPSTQRALQKVEKSALPDEQPISWIAFSDQYQEPMAKESFTLTQGSTPDPIDGEPARENPNYPTGVALESAAFSLYKPSLVCSLTVLLSWLRNLKSDRKAEAFDVDPYGRLEQQNRAD